MEKYVKLIILLIVLYPFKLLYKRINNSISNKDIENGYNIVNKYLVNGDNAQNLLSGLKPKIWIHLQYDKNSRVWESFGSRNSESLNVPYLHLTIKSIIDKCQNDFEIAIVDDDSFKYLIPNYTIDIDHMSFPMKTYARKLYMFKILELFGGFMVPPSLICFKSLIDIYNKGTSNAGCFVMENASQNYRGISFLPDSSFFGCVKNNLTVNNLIKYIESNNKYTNECIFLNSIDDWCQIESKKNNINIFDASIIGAKKINGSPLLIEDILESTLPSLHDDCYCIYVPHDKLLKRSKYYWFVNLSTEEILNSNMSFTKLFLSSY